MSAEKTSSNERIDEEFVAKNKQKNQQNQESPKKKIRNSGNNEFSMENARKIGNYLMSNTIGQGTFGKVKIGIHINTKEKVAIKILEKAKITQKSDINRVTREIQILKRVRHPNIGQLYEVNIVFPIAPLTSSLRADHREPKALVFDFGVHKRGRVVSVHCQKGETDGRRVQSHLFEPDLWDRLLAPNRHCPQRHQARKHFNR